MIGRRRVGQIIKALRISGIFSQDTSFVRRGHKEQEGLQIDLLVDRNAPVINRCEMKFYNAQFSIRKDLGRRLKNKVTYFKELSSTQKLILLTLISSFGIKENTNSLGLVDNSLTFEELF